MVLAGPGSGKTLVIINRIKYLIEKEYARPEEILVITFTKAAAGEMRERFERLMGGGRYRVVFGTFHAVFFQILKYAYHYTAANHSPGGSEVPDSVRAGGKAEAGI